MQSSRSSVVCWKKGTRSVAENLPLQSSHLKLLSEGVPALSMLKWSRRSIQMPCLVSYVVFLREGKEIEAGKFGVVAVLGFRRILDVLDKKDSLHQSSPSFYRGTLRSI